LQQYIPREQRENIFLNGKDGGKFALTHADKFDRVLVDAPCSGERHLLKNSEELSEWSPKRSKKLALRQYALMTAALITAKPRGRIVYSTCALSPFENDDVIEELLRRKPGSFEVQRDHSQSGESTKYGRIFLPDAGHGGPIYYAILTKLDPVTAT